MNNIPRTNDKLCGLIYNEAHFTVLGNYIVPVGLIVPVQAKNIRRIVYVPKISFPKNAILPRIPDNPVKLFTHNLDHLCILRCF